MGVKTKPCNLCICQSCDNAAEMEIDDFKKHLSEVHNIDLKTTPFTRSMLMHIDADRWYEYQYQWTENKPDGLRFQQFIRKMRSPDDMMYY